MPLHKALHSPDTSIHHLSSFDNGSSNMRLRQSLKAKEKAGAVEIELFSCIINHRGLEKHRVGHDSGPLWHASEPLCSCICVYMCMCIDEGMKYEQVSEKACVLLVHRYMGMYVYMYIHSSRYLHTHPYTRTHLVFELRACFFPDFHVSNALSGFRHKAIPLAELAWSWGDGFSTRATKNTSSYCR